MKADIGYGLTANVTSLGRGRIQLTFWGKNGIVNVGSLLLDPEQRKALVALLQGAA